MEVPDSNKWIICRICLKNSAKKMLKIFSMDAEAENIASKIRECSGVSLEDCEQYPDSICSKCLTLLKVAHKFRLLCQRSQQQLADLLQLSTPTQHTISDNESVSTGHETKGTSIVKHEAEPTPEDCSNDGVRYMVESDASEETDNIVDDQAAIVGFIEIADSSQNNDVEYLHDDDDLANTHQINLKLDTNSFQSNDDVTMIFEQTGETQIFEIDEPQSQEEAVNQNESKFCEDLDLLVEAKSMIEKKSTKRPRKSKAKTRQASESTYDQDTNSNFICFHCGNIYAERSKLTLHLKMHNKEKPHECEICHKRFAQTPQLSRHMNSHTGSRPFKCKFCPSSFADPSTCIKHERIHTNERPYKCETCGKAFSYSNVLKVHMMTHTGEKPFSCKFCGKKFAQLHHKKAHERTHNNHQVLKVEEDDIENFQYE